MDNAIRVLHVDDDPSFTELTSAFLSREADRIRVETASDADEGMERLAAERFDCVVSDYEMPGMDGIEFLEAVRAAHPDLPFILFTGKGSEEIASEAISAGATDYLQKGSTDRYRLLANRIRNVVEQSREKQRRTDLERVRGIVSDVNQTLVRSDSRERIEQQVCEILADADPYRFAAFTDIAGDGRVAAPRAWAGTGSAFLDEIELGGDEETGARTFTGGELSIIRSGQSAPGDGSPDGSGAGGESATLAVVPLAYNSTRYGLLLIVADSPDAFDETERGMLTELGDDISHALASIDAREALSSEKERFRLLTESAMDAIVTIDTESVIQFANPAVEEVFGYTPEELVGESLTMLLPEQYRSRHRDAVARYLETGERTIDWSNIELPGLRKDGEQIDLSISFSTFEDGGKRRFEGIIRDLTERKQREQRLAESERRYRTLAENFPDGGVFLLDDELRHQLVTGTVFDSISAFPSDLEGKTVEEVDEFPPELQVRATAVFERALDGESTTTEVPLGDRTYELRVTPIRDDEGGVTQVLGISQDITERIERQETLERQNERLSEFADIVSHDLRNPLSIAEGRLELARAECESDHLESAATAIERSQALIDDLLTLAREGQRTSEIEEVELARIVERCWRNVPTAEATLTVETDRAVRADPSRLGQLFENLFRNSVEHGRHDVGVTVGDIEDGFFLADDGPGIAADERERVFDAGYTTADDGTGYGLSIVEQVVKAHGWDVRVTESADGGARFEIRTE